MRSRRPEALRRVPALRKEAANQMDAILTPPEPVATRVATKPPTPILN
jgi:hypothetical protein